MARNEQGKIRKLREATIYALWRSMPLVFHDLPIAKLASMGCDVNDETFQQLIQCKTKTQFKEMFHLGWETIVAWDRNKKVLKMIDDFNKESNVLRFKKDIDFHFTQATMREADAARVKLWKQLYEGWIEKQAVQTDALEKVANDIKKIADKK